jgi:hypothetical protein
VIILSFFLQFIIRYCCNVRVKYIKIIQIYIWEKFIFVVCGHSILLILYSTMLILYSTTLMNSTMLILYSATLILYSTTLMQITMLILYSTMLIP